MKPLKLNLKKRDRPRPSSDGTPETERENTRPSQNSTTMKRDKSRSKVSTSESDSSHSSRSPTKPASTQKQSKDSKPKSARPSTDTGETSSKTSGFSEKTKALLEKSSLTKRPLLQRKAGTDSLSTSTQGELLDATGDSNDPFGDIEESSTPNPVPSSDDLFEDEPEADPFDDLFDEDDDPKRPPTMSKETYAKAKAAGQSVVDRGAKVQELIDEKYGYQKHGGDRVFTVKLGYNDSGLLEGQMLMEIAAMRGTIPQDWGVAEWRRFMDNTGALPFRLIFGDTDRYHLAIYGAEYLRIWETKEDRQVHGQWKPHDDFDPTAENVAQDGRTLGGVDDDPLTPPIIPVKGEAGIGHRDPVTVSQQIAQQTTLTTAKNRIETKLEKDAQKRRPTDTSPNDRVWEIAIEMARKPRAEWEGQVDWMLEQKIKYAYGWLRETSDFPKPYPEKSLEIFWPIRSYDLRQKEDVQRRYDITGKVIDYFRKAVSKNGEGINLHSESYRVTLSAMELQEAIEEYVKAGHKFVTGPEGQTVADKDEEKAVQRAAKKYFHAHFPVEAHGAGAGPLSTMDPDYVEYMRLCHQYKLQPGTLLHEAKL